MNRKGLSLVCSLAAMLLIGASPAILNAQIYEPEGLNMPGAWNSWTNPPTNNLALASSTQVTGGRVTKITTGTTRWQTIIHVDTSDADLVGGNYNWIFTSGPSGSPYNNKWAGVNVTMNTLQSYSFNTGSDNNVTLTNGNWYTVNWRDQGYDATTAIFMQTSAEPVQFETVSQSPLAASVNEDEPVTVTIETSAAPAAEERVYVWYQIGTANSVVQVDFDGEEGTAEIPGQDDDTVVTYRIISTTVALSSGESDSYYWMRTIRFSGSNSYTVAPPEPPSAIVLTSPADEVTGLLSRITFEWEENEDALTYEIQVASDAGFTSLLSSASGLTSTSRTFDVGFAGEAFWRVRGVNNGGNGDWSDVRSFETVAATATYLANGLGGFGEPVGGSTLQLYDDGTTITGVLHKGLGNFNDRMVIYIANGSEGRSSIPANVNDRADNSRRAVSFSSVSALNFPAGFQATHAISIGTGAYNLFSIPASGAVGAGGLGFIRSVRDASFGATDARFSFSFDWDDVGLDGEGPELSFIVTYLNPTGNDDQGFVSNEGFGSGLPNSNVAGGSATFTSFYHYPSGDVTANLALHGVAGWRFLSSPVVGARYSDVLSGLWTQGIPGSSYPDAGSAASNVRVLDGSTGSYSSIAHLDDAIPAGSGFVAAIFQDDEFGVPGSFPKSVAVRGTPRSGDVTVALNDHEQFTLAGNPYPYPVNFAATTRTGLSEVIYVYDYVTPDPIPGGDEPNSSGVGVFRAWNGSAGSLGNYRIAPFQGFLVYSEGESASLTFTNASRSGSTVFRGKEGAEPVTLEMELLGNGTYSSAWVHFSEHASAGLDSRDALKLDPFAVKFARISTLSEEALALDINHHPMPGGITEIPLILYATHGGDYVLRAGDIRLPDGWTVRAVDPVTGAAHSMESGNFLTVALEAGEELAWILQISDGTTTDLHGRGHERAEGIRLHQNWPNPFNPGTQIRFELPEAADVRLEVFDITGRRVAVLADRAFTSGLHSVTLDASGLASGIYVYRLRAGGEVHTKTMTLLK